MKLKNLLSSIAAQWVSHLAAASVGVLVGVGICQELFDIELVEGASTLIGAAFGAVAAIGGAEFVELRRESRRKRELANFLFPSVDFAYFVAKSQLKRIDVFASNHTQALLAAVTNYKDLAQEIEKHEQIILSVDLEVASVSRIVRTVTGLIEDSIGEAVNAEEAINALKIAQEGLGEFRELLRMRAERFTE